METVENKVSVKTSDHYIMSLSQWKIDASRTLLTKQELLAFNERCPIQHLYPLTLKTISSVALQLYSDALDHTNDFPDHFKKLTSSKKHLLICVVGENALGSSILAACLLDSCFEQEFLNKKFKPLMNLKKIITCMRNNAIMSNAANNHFPQEKLSFKDAYEMKFGNLGSFIAVPHCVMRNEQYIFDGSWDTSPVSVLDGQYWLIERQQKRNDVNLYYHITSSIPMLNPESPQLAENSKKCLLWAIDKDHNVLYKKSIEHVNQIRKRFSPDGHCLAIASKKALDTDPYHTLVLMKLGIQKDGSDCQTIFIPDQKNEVIRMLFDPSSTILVVGSAGQSDNLRIYDLAGTLVGNLPGHDRAVPLIKFNQNGTVMVSNSQHTTIFWNMHDRAHIHPINIIKNDFEDCLLFNIRFNTKGDRCVSDMILKDIIWFNGVTGKKIELTQKDYPDDEDEVFETIPLFTPDDRFLITSRMMKKDVQYGDTRLWDARNGELLAILLRDKKDTRGVGLTPDKRHIVTTFKDMTMIKTELFNENIYHTFSWIKKTASFFQAYALYCAHTYNKQHKKDKSASVHLDLLTGSALKKLPKEPCDVLEAVVKYLVPDMIRNLNVST